MYIVHGTIEWCSLIFKEMTMPQKYHCEVIETHDMHFRERMPCPWSNFSFIDLFYFPQHNKCQLHFHKCYFLCYEWDSNTPMGWYAINQEDRIMEGHLTRKCDTYTLKNKIRYSDDAEIITIVYNGCNPFLTDFGDIYIFECSCSSILRDIRKQVNKHKTFDIMRSNTLGHYTWYDNIDLQLASLLSYNIRLCSP